MPEPVPAPSAGRTLVIVGREHPGEAVMKAAAALGVTVKTVASPPGVNPIRAGYAAGELAGGLKASRADLVQCIGDAAILVGGVAAAMAGLPRRIFSPSPPVSGGRVAGLTGALIRTLMRGLQTPRTIYVFANAEEARQFGFSDTDEPRLAILRDDDEAALRALYERALAS